MSIRVSSWAGGPDGASLRSQCAFFSYLHNYTMLKTDVYLSYMWARLEDHSLSLSGLRHKTGELSYAKGERQTNQRLFFALRSPVSRHVLPIQVFCYKETSS